MSKKVNEVKSIIKEREDQKHEAIARIEAELNATRKKLEALRNDLNTVENADQYKTIIREIRDNEEVMTYFGKKKVEAETATLSEEEYKAIIKEINGAFETVKAERLKLIHAGIDKLIKELDGYFDEVSELDDLLCRAGSLMKVQARPLTAWTLANALDPNDYYHLFIDSYRKLVQYKTFNMTHGRHHEV